MHKTILFDQLTPVALYGKIKTLFPGEVTMLFESVVNTADGNFSFITIGAQERLSYKEKTTCYTDQSGRVQNLTESPFSFLKSYYASLDQAAYQAKASEVGFSFVDGFIGFIGYDMVKVFEPVLEKSMDNLHDPLDTPDMDLVRPSIIIAYSHKSAKLTLILNDERLSNEFNEIEKSLTDICTPMPLIPVELEGEGEFSIEEERFKQMVDECKENIRAGDIFQILLANRYTQRGKIDPLSFYRILRSKNPSPYLFLLDYEEFSICGSSPEVMVRLTNGEILLRPIAGTRKRGKTHQRDKELEAELLADPKERAEHLMLIDLGRNDVGRVAKVGTVQVTEMMRVERYSHVMHLVSDVEAMIAEDKDMFDLFAATFTAGTMTGAPKIKAMELIAEYEGLKRGFYSGSVGYFSFNGNMDSSIAIRTSLIKPDSITLQAGAGVVADSIPELEYLEVKNKLGALLATLQEMETL
ncbi:anthranilate synthase component I family protein [Sulfurovum mangrovi]|uniref:anthranilate synthase component I family protein n=1 Tax=Sulfurovum mangrovi TaxID=2893889 RepID=UPI001E3E97D7|nr:anthranilate synthase component I family protein [Sulfurovum mangrovi]UFH59714.1 anthranilate synthase component I family protein [Sulfurovum mangrovi]UFH60860.1 anthranilate synthase component I family protein [Sulfurovum mangrovi]